MRMENDSLFTVVAGRIAYTTPSGKSVTSIESTIVVERM